MRLLTPDAFDDQFEQALASTAPPAGCATSSHCSTTSRRPAWPCSNCCDIHRFNADELETAIGQALLDFYTGGHDTIEQAISEFLTAHHQGTDALHEELASINQQLRDNAAGNAT